MIIKMDFGKEIQNWIGIIFSFSIASFVWSKLLHSTLIKAKLSQIIFIHFDLNALNKL